jgi:HD-GYP domain-containing protein (c-di-GMP phosphodiesterase class II)
MRTGAPIALLPYLALALVGLRPFTMPPIGHASLVGLGALVATVAAYAVVAAGVRRSDARTVLVGSAFGVMGMILTAHGLVTPDFILDNYWLAAFTGAVTIPAGAAMLVLPSIPALCRPQRIRAILVGNILVLVGFCAIAAYSVANPSAFPAPPKAGSLPAGLILAAGLGLLGVVIARAIRTWNLTHRGSDLLVVVGLCWLGAALIASLEISFADLGWWLGHAFEVGGILAIAGSVALDLRRSTGSRPLSGDLRAAELVLAAEAFLGSRVASLLGELSRKDVSTEEHVRRVAYLAVSVGERLGLGAVTLRTLAEGGLLHDVGKLATPDAVLLKPSRLTDEEYATIKRHPADGDRLLRSLGGFGAGVRELVLDHHERLDGGGYPAGKSGDEIGLPARIMATCDVYDALVSPRVYRDAWPVDRALALLHDESGTAFDPVVVAALTAIVTGSAVLDSAA